VISAAAITHYKLLTDLRYVSLIECKLETGRTHQIRAHMKFLGHPLFNDAMYGGNEPLKGTVFSKYKQFVDNCFKVIQRQALHAKTLVSFILRRKSFIQFDSEIPSDFKEVMEKLGELCEIQLGRHWQLNESLNKPITYC